MTLHNTTALQLCLFFTTLLLHFNCIPTARSGVYMMKYALAHPEKFSHPRVAFLLGLVQFGTMVCAELVNIMKGSQRKKPQDLISSYLGFACIIKIPELYLAPMELPIKGAVGTLSLTTGRKQVKARDKMPCHGFFNLVYVLIKWFYNSVYFYFYTFTIIVVPLAMILVEKE